MHVGFEMLKDIMPRLARAAFIFNPETAPYFTFYLQRFEDAARSYAVESIAAPVRTAADIERVVAGLGDRPDTGLVVMPDVFMVKQSTIDLIISLAARHRVPTIYPYRVMVAAGGLVSYGIDTADIHRRAASYVDRILKGDKPADLPVQLPTKFELAVNLKTAKTLGLTVLPTLLTRADEVIE